MNSVRQRLERELETPEVVVPTTNRRTALTSGPTLSTRQSADFAASQNEVTVRPTERTSAASCDFENGDGFVRVRDRMSLAAEMKPEVAQGKTATQFASDAGIAEHNQRQAEKAAEEARAYATGKKVNVVEKQIAEAKAKVAAEAARQRHAQFAFKENAVLHECSDLDDAEKQIFWSRLLAMNADTDSGAAAIVAMEIRASRVQEEQ
jgi:hypothetical protein